MLARTLGDVWAVAEQSAAASDLEYSDFPWWHALTVEPNGEHKSAKMLRKVDIHVYFPTYSKKLCRRNVLIGRRLCAVTPGLLFVPAEIMQIRRRDETLKWARVRGFVHTLGAVRGGLAQIRKDQIEIIRQIEAKLNIPPEMKKK